MFLVIKEVQLPFRGKDLYWCLGLFSTSFHVVISLPSLLSVFLFSWCYYKTGLDSRIVIEMTGVLIMIILTKLSIAIVAAMPEKPLVILHKQIQPYYETIFDWPNPPPLTAHFMYED